MKTVLAMTLLLALIASLAATGGGQVVGGYREVPATDKDVRTAADFAIRTQGKKEKAALVKILKAEVQVVAGRNFRLALEVRVDGGVRQAEAVVWGKLDRTHELTRWEWKGPVRPENQGEPRPFPGKVSQWNGFARHDFQVDGANVIVVVPARPLSGRPWVWRGEFFGAFPNADIELVKGGWHLAYIGVPNLFGSPRAVARWEKFHEVLVKEHGLDPRPGLIGLSRGALYCMAWAAAHPDRTLAVYLDNGVCDFKSWPGGKPKGLGAGQGSAGEWQNLLKAFGFKDDTEAIAYQGNPVDNLAPLARAKVPLLLVYGDSDMVVPHKENSAIVHDRYGALGGPVERIVKPGADHHPHGLTDPRPIVVFFEKAWSSRRMASPP